MCWYIALDARISILRPRPTDVIACFEYYMFDIFLHVRTFMLELMGEYQSRKAGSNSGDP